MHAGAMLGVTRREHSGVGVQAAVRRQERGVNVEHPAEVVIDEPPRQNAQETRERDHIRLMLLQRRRQRALEGAIASALELQHRGGLDTQRGGAGETGRVGAVGDHHRDPRGDAAREARARDGDHVRAAAGNEDGEPERAGAHSWMNTPRAPARTSPMTRAVSPRAVRNSTAAAARSGGTITAMPTPQLKVRYICAGWLRPSRLVVALAPAATSSLRMSA